LDEREAVCLDSTLREICSFAEAVSARELTAAQEDAMALRVLDAVGCALAAARAPDVERACAAVLAMGGGRQSGVILREPSSADRAAFLNGFMVRYLDFNDTYLSLEPCHPSDLVSTALAVGEAEGRSGRQALRALAAGYHVLCALCDAASLRARGWDHVTYGTAAAAVTAGMLLGLEGERLGNAVSLAVVPHVALRQTRAGRLSNWKGAAFANSARNAVFAAYLAAGGVTGPDAPFEGVFGFAPLVSGPLGLRLEPERDRTADTYIKLHPVEYHAQAAVELALELRGRLGTFAPGAEGARSVSRVAEEVEIGTYRAAVDIIADTPDKWAPATRETADHSLPFLVALALCHGRVGAEDIERGMADPAVLDLLRRTRVVEEPAMTARYPRTLPVRIDVRAGGRREAGELEAPLGHVTRPAPADAVRGKFRANAAPVLGEAAAAAWEERFLGIAGRADLGGVCALDPPGGGV
jgi:2-methylcitrate dehydratase